MTEKRFYLLSDKEDAIIFEDGWGLSQQKVCDLLNEQHEENQHLKKTITTTAELLTNQWRENTRIKQTIREAIETERTTIGKSVLKQLLEQME